MHLKMVQPFEGWCLDPFLDPGVPCLQSFMSSYAALFKERKRDQES